MVLNNLKSACFYEYSVRSGYFWSKNHIFKENSQDCFEKSSMAVYGNHEEKTVKSLKRLMRKDNILGVFDISEFEELRNSGNKGNQVLEMIHYIAGSYPYMTLPNNFEQYNELFSLPGNSKLFYSINVGRAHYVLVNLSPFFDKSKKIEQNTINELVLNDLKQANYNRKTVP